MSTPVMVQGLCITFRLYTTTFPIGKVWVYKKNHVNVVKPWGSDIRGSDIQEVRRMVTMARKIIRAARAWRRLGRSPKKTHEAASVTMMLAAETAKG